jgi:hypothetical protein
VTGGDAAPWLAADTAPFGVPVSVRESSSAAPVTAIRDAFVGWWDENRNLTLAVPPAEWQPLA